MDPSASVLCLWGLKRAHPPIHLHVVAGKCENRPLCVKSLEHWRCEKHLVFQSLVLVAQRVPQASAMSYLLPHLHSGFAVDQAILGEEERVVIMR